MKELLIVIWFNSLPQIRTFNNPKEEGMENTVGKGEKTVGKGENAGNQHFLLFPTVFSALSERKIVILATFNFFVCTCFQFGHVQKFVVR